MKTNTPKNQKMSEAKEILVFPLEFDATRLVYHPPVTQKFNIGGADVEVTNAPIRYLDDNDDECRLFLKAPKQRITGIWHVYPFSLAKEEQTPDKATGMQITYPMTSLATINSPTEEEQAYMDARHAIWQGAVDQGTALAEADEPIIPGVSVNSFLAAAKKGDYTKAVKYPFEHPKDDKKKLDTSKPKRQYIKLCTNGTGETLKATTKFYGPGNKAVNPARYVGVNGEFEGCIGIESVYYGTQGPTAPQGASIKMRVGEANFTPITSSGGVPSKRMLGANSAPAEEDDESSGEGDIHDSEGFEKPGSDSSNPMKALKGASKGAPAKAKGAKASTKKPVFAPVPAKPSGAAKAPAKATTAKAAPGAVKAPTTAKAVPAKATPAKGKATAAPAPKAKTAKAPAKKAKEVIEDVEAVEEDALEEEAIEEEAIEDREEAGEEEAEE